MSLREKTKWKIRGFVHTPEPPPPTHESIEEMEERIKQEEILGRRLRKETVMGILENDTELLQEVILELRNKKINQLKK